MRSRLGDAAPQAPKGAARFAYPTHDVITSKRERVPKRQMSIRLTREQERALGRLQSAARDGGMTPREATASEIVGALIVQADPEQIVDLLRRGD